MRLLHVSTFLFREFHDSHEIPPYIIASHRWAAQDGEATYKGLLKMMKKKKGRIVEGEGEGEGYKKVERFCGMYLDDEEGVCFAD